MDVGPRSSVFIPLTAHPLALQVPNLHSSFDGLVKPQPSNCEVQGWAWSADLPQGGVPPLNVSLTLNGKHMATVVANVNRPGLVPKTGAPNPEHGFLYTPRWGSWALEERANLQCNRQVTIILFQWPRI